MSTKKMRFAFCTGEVQILTQSLHVPSGSGGVGGEPAGRDAGCRSDSGTGHNLAARHQQQPAALHAESPHRERRGAGARGVRSRTAGGRRARRVRRGPGLKKDFMFL